MPILYVGTIPMTVAVVVRLLLLGHPFYWAMASMAVGVHVYFVFLAKGLNSTALAMLEFRAEKDALIAELEEEKAISDEARRRAEGANVAKSRFLATMSHELRTPLNAILGFSEVMKTEMLGPMQNPTYKEYAGNIHDSGSHLLHLINEILDLSRIEAGRYELHEEPFRLIDIVEDCHRLLKLRAESKGLEIVLDLDAVAAARSGPTSARCARSASTCCRTRSSSRRAAAASRSASTATPAAARRCRSATPDPASREEEIPRIMQAFGQGSLAHETAEGGTGLGLPIVKNLVELHGGTFELRSELRKGTEVLVTIPRPRVMEADAAAAAAGPGAPPSAADRRARRPGTLCGASCRLARPIAERPAGSRHCHASVPHPYLTRQTPGRSAEPWARQVAGSQMESPCIQVCVVDTSVGAVLGLRADARRNRLLEQPHARGTPQNNGSIAGAPARGGGCTWRIGTRDGLAAAARGAGRGDGPADRGRRDRCSGSIGRTSRRPASSAPSSS